MWSIWNNRQYNCTVVGRERNTKITFFRIKKRRRDSESNEGVKMNE